MALNAQDWAPDFARHPFFLGLRRMAGQFATHSDWPALADLDAAAAASGILNASGRPVRFEAQSARCGQRDYETGIFASGRVPTRARNMHDFMNALIWLAWPRSKAALNAFQARQLATSGALGRSTASDAATLFDESGLVLLARDPELARLLRLGCWREAFWAQRASWRETRLYVFGHALLERSGAPLPGITGRCLALACDAPPASDAAVPSWLDAAVAKAWSESRITRPADLFPLPILGVPGYHPGNALPAFYDDSAVFRPRRAEESR